MKPNKHIAPLVTMLACATAGVVSRDVYDRVYASKDADKLQKEAVLSLCESSRVAVDHILGHHEAHNVADDKLGDFRAQNEALQTTTCVKESGEKSYKLLNSIFASAHAYPTQTPAYENSPNSELREEADSWEKLGDIEFLAKIGIKDMPKRLRVVSHAAMRLADAQRQFMGAKFLRRNQAK